MNIELTTPTETAPLEILDVQVTARRSAGRSLLSMRFLLSNDSPANHLDLPTLSWFDAGQIQRFTQALAHARHPETIEADLLDAGLRLTGFVRATAGHRPTARTIQVESLPTRLRPFVPVTIYASRSDLNAYAGKLYNKLWEVFTRG